MILRIPEAIFINRNVRPKEDPQEIEVECFDDAGEKTIWFGYKYGAVNLCLTIAQLRAIMRLFDVPDDETAG